MNRLQKKCIIGTVGIHLLLLLILIVGPAFFNQQPKIDNSQILDVIPSTLVDAAVNSGVANARPPAPQLVVTQPPTPMQPIPLPPKIVQPPTPVPTPPPAPMPTPSPSLLERFRTYFTPKPAPPEVTPNTTPTERQEKQHNDIKISTQLVKRSAQQSTSHTESQSNAKAVNSTLRSLSHELSSSTKIDMPGSDNTSSANYGDVVISIYHHAWEAPTGMSSDNVTVKFKVKIARDGTVISSEIVEPSGDPNVDAAVQHMLDRVTFIAPFPEGTTDQERVYPINFIATRISE